MALPKNFSEGKFLFIIAVVQFINTLDFIMVMPLGPDLAKGLNIPLQHMGWIGGSYTMAASITGFIAALFLDRFDRRRVILISLFGLGIATMLPALAWNTESLIFARVLAGICGGPLTASAGAMVADIIPSHRRGAASGKTMGAFSVASVLGLPFGLELSSRFSWHAPFLSLGVIALIAFVLAWRFLPAGVNEKSPPILSQQLTRMGKTFRDKLSWNCWGIMIVAMIAGFMVLPNLSTHIQNNMHYPRADLGFLYMVGGTVTFCCTRFIGRLVDKSGGTLVSMISVVLMTLGLTVGVLFYQYGVHPLFLTVAFSLGMTTRNIAAQTIASQVPLPDQRASFMSINTAMTHGSASIGAFIGSLIVAQGPNMELLHMDRLVLLSIGLSLFIPVFFMRTEKLLKQRKTQPAPIPDIALTTITE